MKKTIRIIDEIWKPIKDYEGLYEVSNLGNVRSLDHMRKISGNGEYLQKGKVLKNIKNNSGYIRVTLSKEGKRKNKHIHRLVAEAFIPNPNNLSCINHKDENPLNNNVNNLELCTRKYNDNYGNRNNKIAKKLSKKIDQFDINGNYIKTWDSSVSIERETELDQSNICLCCKGKRKSVGGYIWKYSIN